MAVPVMDVGEVRMRVGDRRVPMWMRVWFLAVPVEVVLVLVVFIVYVTVRVEEPFVRVFVLVAFGEVQRDPGTHEYRGKPEL